MTSQNKKVDVLCPNCGEIYPRMVETEYLNSPYAWYRAFYPVILCEQCKKEISQRKKLLARNNNEED